ncbi:MAG TPA: ribosome maturation factor RimP [Acidimicrobiia bacterium]|nr:ribosome maturation factor RimP [Acidimicrobiia bacterium]
MLSVVDRLWDRIGPYVAAEDVELDDVEVLGGGQIVRVTVDADDPLGVDRIAELSRGISRIIDEEDPIPTSYTLEVSSPGLERRLRRPRHYEKSIGKQIRVKTLSAVEGEKTHTGNLTAADDDGFTIDVDGLERTLAYAQVASARTVFEWETSTRPGKSS